MHKLCVLEVDNTEYKIPEKVIKSYQKLQQENQKLKEEKDKITKMYQNDYKYSQKMEDKYILTKSIIDEVRELRKEFLDVNENQLIVFENNELIVFMNKLHDILNKVGDVK